MANLLKYSTNEFISQTKKSVEKALLLIMFHLIVLNFYLSENDQDEDFQKMVDRTKTPHDDFVAKYNIYFNVLSEQEAQTLAVDLRIKSLKGSKGYFHQWYNAAVFLYETADPARLKNIFPDGLKISRVGKDQIILNLDTLIKNIGNDTNPTMVSVKAAAIIERDFLVQNRELQKTDIKKTETRMKELHALSTECMKMEYRNAGLLLDKYPDNENNVQESFHDMELLLGKQQTVWNITLEANEVFNIGTRTQLPTSKLAATAKGGNVKMYLGSVAKGTDSTAVVLTNGIRRKFIATAFEVADYKLNRNITVVNQTAGTVSFKLKLG